MSARSLDALLQLVADRRRRKAIRHLRQEAHGKTTIDTLVDWLHTGGSDGDGQPPDREQIAIQFHHVHLPKLTDHGVVDFDSETGTVRYRPDEQIETVLDSLPDELSLAHP